jgi:hypothetical protein
MPNMQNTLVGFTHDNGFRVFSFDRVGEDRVRTRCTVRADMALIRAHGIRVQELPLLCRGLLDRCEEGSAIQSFTFEEVDMRHCADERTTLREEAAKKRKPWRRPAGEAVNNFGSGSSISPVKTAPVFERED